MARTTCYSSGTPQQVKDVLEKYMHDYEIRLRLWYGDTKTGEAWDEEHDVIGYIGRSTGEQPIALLIHNKRSMGGSSILTDCVIRIDTTGGRTLYKHQNFNAGTWTVNDAGESFKNGQLIGRHGTKERAQRFTEFMTGKRYTK